MTQNVFYKLAILFSAASAFAGKEGVVFSKQSDPQSASARLSILNKKDFFLHIPDFLSSERSCEIQDIETLKNLMSFYAQENVTEAQGHKLFTGVHPLIHEMLKIAANNPQAEIDGFIGKKSFWESLKTKGVDIKFFVPGNYESKIWNFLAQMLPADNMVVRFCKSLDVRQIYGLYGNFPKGMAFQKIPAHELEIDKFVNISFPIEHLFFQNLEVNKITAQFIHHYLPSLKSLKFEGCFFEFLPVVKENEAPALQVLHLDFPRNKYFKTISAFFPQSLLRQLKDLKLSAYDQFLNELTTTLTFEIGNHPKKNEVKKDSAQKNQQMSADFMLEKLSCSMPKNAYLVNLRLFELPHLRSLKLAIFDRLGEGKMSCNVNDALDCHLSEIFYRTSYPVWPTFAQAALPSLETLKLKDGILLSSLGKSFDPSKIKKLIFYGDPKNNYVKTAEKAINLADFPNLETFGSQLFFQSPQELKHPNLKKWVILEAQANLIPGSCNYDFPKLEVIRVKVPQFKKYTGSYYNKYPECLELHYPAWKVDNPLISHLLDHQKNETLTLLVDIQDDPLTTLCAKYTQIYYNRKITVETLKNKVKIVSTLIEPKAQTIQKPISSQP